MARHTLGFITPPIVFSNGPIIDIRPSATDFARVMEIELIMSCPNGSTPAAFFGIGNPASVGTVSRSLTPIPEDSSITSIPTTVIGYDWSVLPTIPTAFMRRYTSTNNTQTSGQRFLFKFLNGISISSTKTLALWLLTGNNVTAQIPIIFDINVVLDL